MAASGVLTGTLANVRLSRGTTQLAISSGTLISNITIAGNTFRFNAADNYALAVSLRPAGAQTDINYTLELFNETTSVVSQSFDVSVAPDAAPDEQTFIFTLAANVVDFFSFRIRATQGGNPNYIMDLSPPAFRAVIFSMTAAAGSTVWSDLTAPVGNLALGHGSFTTAFTWGAATGAGVDMWTMADTAGNTGTGRLVNIATAAGSVLRPFRVAAAGTEAIFVSQTGVVGIGTTTPGAFKLDIVGDTRVTGKLTVTGALDPTSVLLSGGTALFFESNNGETAPISGAATGRLRYNNTTGTWQASVQGGAYVNFFPAVSSSGWTDDGTVVRLTTSTDRVTIGSATGGGKLFIDGDANEIQLQVQSHSTQTANIAEFQNNAGTALCLVNFEGEVFSINASASNQRFVAGFGVSNGQYGVFGFNVTNARTFISSTGATHLLMQTGSHGTDTGNVGIGIPFTSAPGAKLQVDTDVASKIVVILKAAAAQSANILEIQDSAATVQAVIDSSFNLQIPAGLPRLRLGSATTAANNAVAVGPNASAGIDKSVAVGEGASTSTAGIIAIGRQAVATAGMMFGIEQTNSTAGACTHGAITDFFGGTGASNATPTATVRWAGCGASGTDVAAGAAALVGGKGTGTGAGGNALIQVAYPGTTGSSQNSLVTVATFLGDNNDASGTQNLISFTPTVNQSGTAGYTGFLVNVTETATGSGTKRFFDVQLGGSTRFFVDTAGATVTGKLTVTGGIDPTFLELAGIASNTYLNMTNGDGVAVSAASQGRIVYNSTTQTFQVSQNGVAYVNLGTATTAGGWTDDGTVVRLTTSTDNVTIGSATGGGKLFIDGDTDEIQLQVQAHSTQTANIFVVQNSAGSNLLSLSNTGSGNPGRLSLNTSSGANRYDFDISATGEAIMALKDSGNQTRISFTTTAAGVNYFSVGHLSVGTTSDLANLGVVSTGAAVIGAVIRGAASQTANIFVVQNSAGNNLLTLSNTGSGNPGRLSLNTSSGASRYDFDISSSGDAIAQLKDSGNQTRINFTTVSAGVNYFSVGHLSVGTTSDLANLGVVSTGAAVIGAVIRGAASQTANILETQNSSGTVSLSMGSGAGGANKNLVLSPIANTSAFVSTFDITAPNEGTWNSALADSIDVDWNFSRAITWGGQGDNALYRTFVLRAPTHNGGGGFAVTTGITFDIVSAPVAGTMPITTAIAQRIQTGVAAGIGLVIKGAASQTGNLFICQSNAEATLDSINASGDLTVSPAARTTGSPTLLTVTGPAHTGLTNAEASDANFNLARTVTFTGGGGAIANQRAFRVQAPTYAASAAQTITDAATFEVDGVPVAGANVTLTNAWAARFGGAVRINGQLVHAGGGIDDLKIQGATVPAAFTAAADTNGQDVFFRTPSGGAHTAANPRGGDLVIQLGAAGSGGAGRFGQTIFKADGGTCEVGLQSYATADVASQFRMQRARGSQTTPTIVASGDSVGLIIGEAYDGAAFLNLAQIRFEVDGTPGTNDMPGRIRFLTTADGASTATEAMRITNAQLVGINKTSGISAQLHVQTASASRIAAIAQGAAAQSANIFEAQDSTGSAFLSVASSGRTGLNTASPDEGLDSRHEISIFGSSASLARLRLRGFYTSNPSNPASDQTDIIVVDDGVAPVFRVRYNDAGTMKEASIALA